MNDNMPRYTTKRLHDEIERAKAYATREERERCSRLARSRADDYALAYEDGEHKAMALAAQAALVALALKIEGGYEQ